MEHKYLKQENVIKGAVALLGSVLGAVFVARKIEGLVNRDYLMVDDSDVEEYGNNDE